MQNTDLIFRKAKTDDIERIMLIMAQAKEQMRQLGTFQWKDDYPSTENIADDIRNNDGYVFEKDGKVIAYGAVSSLEEPVYRQIDSQWESNLPYIVVHRLAIADEAKRQGLGKLFMIKAEDVAKEKNIRYFRVDTKHDNKYMLRIFESLNFIYRGEVVYRGDEKRVAFEKKII